VRLALSVEQAVSYCRGFDPAAQHTFWRHVVPPLWSGVELPLPHRLALSRATFEHVRLQWSSYSRANDAFWIGFFLHGAPACDAVLTAVVNKLRPHVEIAGALPPVCGGLSCSHSYETTYSKRPL
jgi:hypothetical protein